MSQIGQPIQTGTATPEFPKVREPELVPVRR